MASMRYCRFENTNLYFGRCVNDLQELIGNERGALSYYELRAAKSMAMNAQHFIKALAEYAESHFGPEDVDPIEYCFDDVIDRINEDADGEDGDDE